MAPLYHMVEAKLWTDCKQQNRPYFPPTYAQDGFIHLSADPALLLQIANHFYKSSRDDWLVLVLDPAKLTAQVKFEPAAPVGSVSSAGLLGDQQSSHGETAAAKEPLFPHLYGTIDLEAVADQLPMQRDESGTFLSISGLPGAGTASG